MASLEHICTTLVFVAASTITLASCDKEKAATQAPASEEPGMPDAESAEDAASDEPAEDNATSGEVDHEAMSHGDANEGGTPPPDEG